MKIFFRTQQHVTEIWIAAIADVVKTGSIVAFNRELGKYIVMKDLQDCRKGVMG